MRKSPACHHEDPLDVAPYWWQAAPRPATTAAPVPGRTDVLVVGSGYTGLSAARTLAQGGREVCVLERSQLGYGASTRNAGMMSGALKSSFTELMNHRGRARAREIYGESIEARAYIHTLIDEAGIECARRAVGRLTPAVTAKHYDAMARDAELLNRELDVNTYGVPRSEQTREIGSDIYHGCVVHEGVWSFHPALYHQGLLDLAREAGAAVLDHTEVTRISRTGTGFDVETSRGRVQASNVVIATNGYTSAGLGWWRRRVVPVSSQMVSTVAISNNLMTEILPKGRVVVESSRLFHYLRPSPDGTRLLAGGRFGGSDRSLDKGVSSIREWLTRVFPAIEGVAFEHTWDGNTAFSRDFMPHMGIENGVHYALGFCGSGTVWGTWLGHKVALKILGDSESASCFDRSLPGIPFHTGRPWFLPPVLGWYAMRDRLERDAADA